MDVRRGRVSRNSITTITGENIVNESEMITWEQARKIEQLGLDKILVRSPMTCEAGLGICALCYGMDLSTGNLVEQGMAVGIIASVTLQALINMSVVLDIGPTKGIPLPMISYGGSSLLSTLTSLGMLLSISEHAG